MNEIQRWDDLRLYLTSLKNLNYIIACKEIAPTTKHPHIHVYCQFSKPSTITLSRLQGAHLEICKGSAQENIEYIKKTKDPDKRGEIIYEDGTPLYKGGCTIKAIKEMPRDERENLPIQYYKIVQQINTNEDNLIDINNIYKDIEVYWIWGPSGIGKTKRAIKMFKDKGYTKICQVKYTNDFWIGTNTDTEACLYDDFRDSHMKPSELINFIDYNIHPMNIKGGSIQNNYKYIIITSIQDPEKIYINKDDEEKKQWLRRIKEIIHLDIV